MRKWKVALKNVYAVGDCAEIFYGGNKSKTNVELLWYTGKKHGNVAAKKYCGFQNTL